jgi:CRISPR type III-associated protein (TIGR04423 family)
MEKKFATIHSELSNIPSGDYEGYYWVSDNDKPERITGIRDLEKLKSHSVNPFIMEALLFDRSANRSIHIQHAGRYLITEFDWERFDEELMVSDMTDKITVLPQKIGGVSGLEFIRVWKKESDPLCDGKEVLKMQAIVFCGFKNL